MKKALRLIPLLGILLASCVPGLGFGVPPEPTPDTQVLATQAATIVAGALRQTETARATFQTLPLGGVKPADSDLPAAGICAEMRDDPVTILLGAGPDGLPVGGRCVAIGAGQRILFINQSDTEFYYKLPGLTIDLPAGQQFLLDKPAGSLFGPGVHFIPTGPELWIKGVGSGANPTQAATMPGPLRSYENPGLGYALTLPPGWSADETNADAPNHEVLFSPDGAEPFVVYLSVSQDSRSIEEIQASYAQHLPDAVMDEVVFNGLPGIKYTRGMRMEFYLPYQGSILLITTDKPDEPALQLILMSIRFI